MRCELCDNDKYTELVPVSERLYYGMCKKFDILYLPFGRNRYICDNCVDKLVRIHYNNLEDNLEDICEDFEVSEKDLKNEEDNGVDPLKEGGLDNWYGTVGDVSIISSITIVTGIVFVLYTISVVVNFVKEFYK